MPFWLGDQEPSASPILLAQQGIPLLRPAAHTNFIGGSRLSHDDLDWNGQSKWKSNGYVWAPDPLWFYWGYLTGMARQKNPILLIRLFVPNAPVVTGLTHLELQPGLFKPGIDLATNAGSYFAEPAGSTYSGPLDPPGWHRRLRELDGDPDGLGGPNELTWEMSGGLPVGASMLYRAGTRAHRFVDTTDRGPLLDIRADYTPLIPAVTPPAPFALYFTGAATAYGTYRGRKVTFMSGWARFMDATQFVPVVAGASFYQAFVFSGTRPDGKREWGACYVTGDSYKNYTGFGAYCREGEAPVCSHQIRLKGEWVANKLDPSDISPRRMTYSWTSPDTGKSVELHAQGTHSCNVQGQGKANELYCDWYEKGSTKRWYRSMAAIEYGIKEGAVPISGLVAPGQLD